MKTEEMIEPKGEEIIEDPLKIEPILNIKSEQEVEYTDPLIVQT